MGDGVNAVEGVVVWKVVVVFSVERMFVSVGIVG